MERFRPSPIEPPIPITEPFVPEIIQDPLPDYIKERVEFAFGRKTKDKIVERDGGKSVLSGSDQNLEVAHINHDKHDPFYDDPSNGRLLTTTEHLMDHKNREGRNGLTPEQNQWAIGAIQGRLKKKYGKIGDPGSDD